ncbi:MAG: hypothetical protein II932_05785, partial [Treponema sp.]|nr:hypothetical protein [Treponema sp.]
TAGVLCYGGTADYSWSPSGTAIGPVSGTGTHNENAGISPAAGGLSTLTVTATLADGRVLTKDIDVYVLDLTLSKGGSLLGASDPVFITDATGDIPSATLTAALDGLAGLSGVSYSWQVGSTSVATVSPAGSTPSATATVSSAAAGTTMVQVTASYKGVTTVPVSRPLCVVGLAVKKSGTVLTGDLVMAKDAVAPTGLTAEVSGYGAGVNYSWSPSGTALGSVSGTGTHNENASLTPAAGGKSTLTVTASITANGMTLSKTIDVYVFDLNLSGPGLTGPDASGNYTLVTSTNDTSGVAVNASLAGTGMPSVSYTWTPGSGADTYIELNGSAAASRTVKPRAAGSASFTVGVSYGGTTVTSRTVNVSVAGIVFTTFPKSFAMGGATNSISLSAEVQGYSGSVSWGTWGSGSTTVASVGGQTNSGSSSSVTLTAAAGGKTEITLSATVGGVTLTAKKEIYILQLTLNCGDGSFTPPSGIADPNYKLTLIKGNPLTTDITANLAGLPEGSVSYTWTPLTSTKLNMTASGTGNKTVRLAPLAAGNETVSVQATYDGESITKSVDVAVVGIALTGSSTLVFNSDPTAPAGANDIALTATLENIGLTDLTDSGIQFTSNATSIATVTAGTATSTGRPATVTALKGGTVTITVTAAIRASGKVFSAKKDITIIRLLVKDGADHDVPATGNSLTDGPVTLSAEFEGLTEGVDFSWGCTPSSGSDISISATSGQTTTVSGSSGTASVTLTATYDDTDYTKTMEFRCQIGSKAAPDAVGDIVFNDGSAEPYSASLTLTDEQKAAAVAVIFDAANKKGVGLKQGSDKRWADSGTAGYNNIAALAATQDSGSSSPSLAVFSGAGAT